jgi:hypothetical protein
MDVKHFSIKNYRAIKEIDISLRYSFKTNGNLFFKKRVTLFVVCSVKSLFMYLYSLLFDNSLIRINCVLLLNLDSVL